jgi:DNA polymerase-3 subunit alpha
VITQVRRQISKKTGKEYARLTLEDFHGTADAIVFPDSWSRLNQVVKEDLAMLLTGGYSARDRDEERAPFVIESARPLDDLLTSGALGLALRWKLPEAPAPETLRQAVAMCSKHPGPAPLYIEWSDGNGERLRARSRRIRVAPDQELLAGLRQLLGPDAVAFVKAG